MRIHGTFVAAAALCALSAGLPAQERERDSRSDRDRDDRRRPARVWSFFSREDEDRPRIGITTGSSGKRDTLGVLVTDVTEDGPAAKAGIEEGDRIAAVNGVNLRLSPADAGEEDMEGIATRRLVRELGKLEAGDEVELRVYRDGQTKSVTLKTVPARDLERAFLSIRGRREDREDREDRGERAVLGIGLGTSGSRRDTLGILVMSVNDEGPAAKAGLEEGDRIASINGVDLRVAREDAGDWSSSSIRIRRLGRELEKLKAGDEVELRVIRAGQPRTVNMSAVAAKDLPRNRGSMFISSDDHLSDFGGMGAFHYAMPAMPAMPPMPAIAPVPMPRMAPMPPTSPRAPRVPRAPRAPIFHYGEGFGFGDGVGGEYRVRVSPEMRTEIRERSAEAMRRAFELQSHLRNRIRIEMDDDDDAAPAAVIVPRAGRVVVSPHVVTVSRH